MIAFGLLFFHATLGQCTELPSAIEINSIGEWVKRDENGRAVFLSQCGWNVSLLTLNCFGIPSHRLHMAEAIPPTDEGVNLADIETWLVANCLKCMPRKNVCLDDIEAFLRPKMMAIFAVNGTVRAPRKK